MNLVPCPDCGRHLLARETRCPFCQRPAPATGWLGAAALAAGLVLTAGCPEGTPPKPPVPPQPQSTPTPAPIADPTPAPPVAKYGAPPVGPLDPVDRPQPPRPSPTPAAPAYGVPPPNQLPPLPPK